MRARRRCHRKAGFQFFRGEDKRLPGVLTACIVAARILATRVGADAVVAAARVPRAAVGAGVLELVTLAIAAATIVGGGARGRAQAKAPARAALPAALERKRLCHVAQVHRLQQQQRQRGIVILGHERLPPTQPRLGCTHREA